MSAIDSVISLLFIYKFPAQIVITFEFLLDRLPNIDRLTVQLRAFVLIDKCHRQVFYLPIRIPDGTQEKTAVHNRNKRNNRHRQQ